MGSERRQRTEFVAVRLDPLEMAWLSEQAIAASTSRSELVRALVFGRAPVRKPAPCSPKHDDCTRHHRELVDGYHDQRYREELQQEAETGLNRGDLELWAANGGHLTTFADWLTSTARSEQDR